VETAHKECQSFNPSILQSFNMDPIVKYFFLRENTLFAPLTDEQVKQLCKQVKFRRARKGEFIYMTGEASKPIYFLLKGRIKLAEGDEEGNELIKEMVHPGESFGEMTFDDSDPNYEYAAVTSSEAWVGSLSVDQFEQLMESNPVFALHFVRKLAAKFRKLENRFTNLVLMDVKPRLISFLKDWARSEGKRQGNRIVLDNPMTHQEIAGIIAASRQTVTSLLNELKSSGHLHYTRTRLEICDIEAFGKPSAWQVVKTAKTRPYAASLLAAAG
jgi:CRP-like cAMP-binding protein